MNADRLSLLARRSFALGILALLCGCGSDNGARSDAAGRDGPTDAWQADSRSGQDGGPGSDLSRPDGPGGSADSSSSGSGGAYGSGGMSSEAGAGLGGSGGFVADGAAGNGGAGDAGPRDDGASDYPIGGGGSGGAPGTGGTASGGTVADAAGADAPLAPADAGGPDSGRDADPSEPGYLLTKAAWFPSGYTILHSSYYVVPDHLGSAVLGALGQINGSASSGPDASAPTYVTTSIAPFDPSRNASPVRVHWDFQGAPEAFGGIYLSLNAQSEIMDSLDGVAVEKVPADEFVMNLNDLNAPLSFGAGPKESVDGFCARVRYQGSSDLTVKWEIKNPPQADDRSKVPLLSALSTVHPKADWQEVCLRLANLTQGDPSTAVFDPTRAKELTVVVLSSSVIPPVSNPGSGDLDIDEIWLTGPNLVSRDALLALSDAEFAKRLAFKAAVQLVHLASPTPAIRYLGQDRNSFADLVSVASTGFILAGLPEAVSQGWLPRETASAMAAQMLAKLASCPDSAHATGSIVSGYCKHRGIFYHFLGRDGARKRNFDYPNTAQDESRNLVELSTIDTGILLAGAAAAETFFDGSSADEQGLRASADSLIASADWRFLYSPNAGQLHMSWEPAERDIVPGAADGWGYAYADACAPVVGYFASRPASAGTQSCPGYAAGAPLNLDFYTAELNTSMALALGQANADLRPPSRLWMNIAGCADGQCLGSSGAMFIYEFDRLLGLDTKQMLLPTGQSAYDQSCQVHSAAIAKSWGRLDLPDAYETPFEGTTRGYVANSLAETLNACFSPDSDRAIAPYAWAGSAACDSAAAVPKVIAALRALVRLTPAYNPLTGLADRYDEDVGYAANVAEAAHAVLPAETRRQGPWVNYTAFGIDQGPILLGLALADCSLEGRACPPRLAGHPAFTAALANAACKDSGWIEGEWGTVVTTSQSCARGEQQNRCGAYPCEAAAGDNFPMRASLSGGQAVQIFDSGTALKVPSVRAKGAATLSLAYSLNWPAADAAGVVLKACWDSATANCSTITNLAPTSSWDVASSVDVILGDLVSACGPHDLYIVAETLPRSWGVQIDRIRVH